MRMRAIGAFVVLAFFLTAQPGGAGVRAIDAFHPALSAEEQAQPILLAQNAQRDANRRDGESVPARSLQRIIKSKPEYKNAQITNVYIRKPAQTKSGFMYEVWVRQRNGAETLVYVDPDTRQILYEAPGRR
ncbi:MAG: hypothetical protein AAGH74_14700 [Pseudomonadota bacterium]